MLLKSVVLSGYRSFRYNSTLHVDPRVTVIVGANDHGKSNLLKAILHLNEDNPLDVEDKNWDTITTDGESHSIYFHFALSETERSTLLAIENKNRGHTSDLCEEEEEEEEEEGEGEGEVSEVSDTGYPKLTLDDIPSQITVVRDGTTTNLYVLDFDEFEGKAEDYLLAELIPGVILIDPWSKLSDSSTASNIMEEASEFMRGIFYYAELDPSDQTLFIQSDETEMRLKNASEKLNRELRASWAQGTELDFVLRHNSAKNSIELKIKDPNVKGRYVRPSRRSSGFTHYFALKTILHARTKENPRQQHIYLFDEPGIYLHPSGQHDLLKVLEKLSLHTQVIYTTHSLFMLNKTYPTRHRLITKKDGSSQINGKPCAGRWGAITSELGLSVVGSVLFANHILITEGDSDPIYIQALLQKLIETGVIQCDLNGFTAIASGDASNADAVIRIFKEAEPSPHISLLVDGDDGGKDRKKRLTNVTKLYSLGIKALHTNTSIEDHLIATERVYVKAAAAYATKLARSKSTGLDDSSLLQSFESSYANMLDTNPADRPNIWDWTTNCFNSIANLPEPSKVGVAREYVQVLDSISAASITQDELANAKKLCTWIVDNLNLPKPDVVDDSIIQQ